MSLFTTSCRICEKPLTLGANFCTSCGAPTIKNEIVQTKSTASFDPLSKSYKPWRDAPLVPKRVYPELDKKFVTIKVPWCPAMKSRQPRKPKNVVVYKPIEKVVEPIVEPVVEEVPIVVPDPPIEEEIVNGELCKEVVVPIGVFDATWLSTLALTVVHLNLVEHSISPGNKTYWLRVDVNLEEEELRDEEGNADAGLKPPMTIAYLSNVVAKFMMADMNKWVDLQAISAQEYYMSQYLQRTLDVVARRVSVGLHSSIRPDLQSYLVMARPVESIRTVEVSEYVDEYSDSPKNYVKDKTQYQIVCFDTTTTEPKQSVTINNEAGSGEFEFNDSIHTSCCKLKVLGQYRGSSYFLCEVHLSVAYLDRMGCREQNYDENTFNADCEADDNDDGDWRPPQTVRMNYQQFEATKKVTNVVLHIVPRVTSNGVVIPPSKISFEVSSLRHLISIESSPNSVHEAHAAGVPLMSLFTMDEFLNNSMEDPKLLPTLIKTLMKIVRIEHDTRNDVVKYLVIGTFAEPGANIPPRVKRPIRRKKKVLEKFVPIVREIPSDDDSDEERRERRAARLRKEAEEEALAEMEDTSKNSATDYKCPRHRIYACRCMKQEILLQYYKKKLPFTLFGEYFWHEELRYNELKVEVGESTVAIRQHAIQQYHHYNLEESGSPTAKKRNARVLQLMNTIPQGFEALHLENLFELIDYVKLGYSLHFENHVTFVGVHNGAYNKAMADMLRDEVPDREDYIYNLQIGYKQLNEVLTDWLKSAEFSDEVLNLNIVRDEIHMNHTERVLAINFIKCTVLGNFFMFNAFGKRIELVFSRDHDFMSLKFA